MIKEALLIQKEEPSINKQFDNFKSCLKLQPQRLHHSQPNNRVSNSNNNNDDNLNNYDNNNNNSNGLNINTPEISNTITSDDQDGNNNLISNNEITEFINNIRNDQDGTSKATCPAHNTRSRLGRPNGYI